MYTCACFSLWWFSQCRFDLLTVASSSPCVAVSYGNNAVVVPVVALVLVLMVACVFRSSFVSCAFSSRSSLFSSSVLVGRVLFGPVACYMFVQSCSLSNTMSQRRRRHLNTSFVGSVFVCVCVMSSAVLQCISEPFALPVCTSRVSACSEQFPSQRPPWMRLMGTLRCNLLALSRSELRMIPRSAQNNCLHTARMNQYVRKCNAMSHHSHLQNERITSTNAWLGWTLERWEY